MKLHKTYFFVFKLNSKLFILSTFLLLLNIPIFVMAQNPGEKTFKTVCAACHTIGNGRLVGPDLSNILKKRPMKWILQFVKSPQKKISGGDVYAEKLFKTYKIMMPDQKLSDIQIKDVIDYIMSRSGNVNKKSATTSAEGLELKIKNSNGFTLKNAGSEEVKLGVNYFTGKVRFKNNGPACISCHSVINGNLMTGGDLAKNLTTVYSKLNPIGIKAILDNPPFPVMNAAFHNKPITSDEEYYLIAFLKEANRVAIYQQPNDFSINFDYAGIIGVAILLLIFGGFWRNRKKKSVNDAIYKRQIKSK